MKEKLEYLWLNRVFLKSSHDICHWSIKGLPCKLTPLPPCLKYPLFVRRLKPMLNRNSLTILWWTVPFRWIFWFATIFASVIGFFEVVENYVSFQFPVNDFQQIPVAFFSAGIGVIFLTNEKILNAHKNKKNIAELYDKLSNLETSLSPNQISMINKIEDTSSRLSTYGKELDGRNENKLGKMD